MIRLAEERDAAEMAVLSDNFRNTLEVYSPVFWRKKPNMVSIHTAYFQGLINNPNHITLVHEDRGHLSGFITGVITSAPPVYDPGGPVCLIDDFIMRDPLAWGTLGKDLLIACENSARFRNAVLVIVICPIKCAEQREMLREHGAEAVSEWRVKTL